MGSTETALQEVNDDTFGNSKLVCNFHDALASMVGGGLAQPIPERVEVQPESPARSNVSFLGVEACSLNMGFFMNMHDVPMPLACFMPPHGHHGPRVAALAPMLSSPCAWSLCQASGRLHFRVSMSTPDRSLSPRPPASLHLELSK